MNTSDPALDITRDEELTPAVTRRICMPDTLVAPGAVIWDLDGTIMDSQEGILETMRHTLAEMGCAVPGPSDLFGWIGPPFPSSLRRFTSLDDVGIARAIEVYRDFYQARGTLMSTPFPGVLEIIRGLRADGVVQGLATSKPRTQALGMLEREGVLDVFVARGCASDDETRGTKYEVMSDAIAELAESGIPSDHLVMIGDRIHDFEAAAELGVTSIGVTWGYGNEDEWQHADHVVHTPEELRSLLPRNEAVSQQSL
jgi:phosphoglycolate phosphatase